MAQGTKIIVKKEYEGLELSKFLKKAKIPFPYIFIQKLLRKRAIRVNGKSQKQTYLVQLNDEIYIPASQEDEKAKNASGFVIPKKKPVGKLEDAEKYLLNNIIYKDENIIAINKPQGIATQGGSGVIVSVDLLLDFLKFGNEERPLLVHRIDKDTSGVLLIARNLDTARELTEAFKNREIEKSYLALVVGRVPNMKGRIAKPIGARMGAGGTEKMMVDYQKGKISVTEYRVVEHYASKLTLLEVFPKTGRKHQIRVHLADEGFPILGDGKYGGAVAFVDGLGNNLHLHSWRTSSKNNLFPLIEAKIPDYFDFGK
ncbi:MAG: RluA family pseudouridine synthase [Rickettsiales bacterium]|nr:RluA family pseudouridine synthase [Rickettsiales bacterium]